MNVKYLSSHMDISSLPFIEKEVAFIGRSNVGKSSLINEIAGKKICFTSKKPGKTVTINVFCDDYRKTGLIDLPGYGFAKAAEELQHKWHTLMPEYFLNRSNLRVVFLLVDIRIGFMQTDIDALRLISGFGRKIHIVCTKADKLTDKELIIAKKNMDEELIKLGIPEMVLYYVSNKKPAMYDMKTLRRNIEALLGIK